MQPDLLRLRPEDWRDQFDIGTLQRGQDYASQGRCTLLQTTPDEVDATCLGSAIRRYRQSIQLRPHAGSWRIEGRCSCPVGHNCKHVVAALLILQRQSPPLAEPRAPLPERRIDDLEPVPQLILGSHVRLHYDARKGRMVEQTQHRAALAFRYGEHLAFGKPAKDLLVPGATEILRIRRHPESEARHRQTLVAQGLHTALRKSEALPESAGELLELADDDAWLHWVRHALPRLRALGWRIEMRPDFHYNLLDIDDWYLQLEAAPEQDWFDLEMGIEVQGQRLSLLPILLHAIRHSPWLLTPEALARRADDELLLVPLPRGQSTSQRIALPFGRLRPLLANLGELFFHASGETPQRLRLARPDAARLAALEEQVPLHWQGGETLRDFARRLRDLPQQEVRPPAGLQAELRPYQLQGLAWLQTLRELGVGGVLADDMGLGKTLQTLAHLLLEKEAGRLTAPALIVMPTSLIPNWQDEAARFAPGLRVLALHGSQRSALFEEMGRADLLLTSYALLSRDLKALARQPFHLLILDEAQNIKNPRSKAAQAARELNARHRLCLTGTPMENHLGELWSLFHLLMPGWLGDQQAFKQEYRIPIEKHGDLARLAHLKARVRPFLLRRTKEQVAPELPPKSEITQYLELTEAQRDRYEALRLAMDRKIRAEIQRQGLARSQLLILEALLRLRQVCCDLRLLDDEAAATGKAADSAKLNALLPMLEELFAEGRRVLLFSQFTGMLELIAAELRARKIPYAQLTGSTRDRRTPVEEFQSGRLPVFLISLKAGGAGLNLTAADTVIHFDPWWNPAAEAQASDRAYRIGQDKPVFVYRLIARGSVEEKIQQLQKAKAELARGLLEGAVVGDWRMDEEDIAALFAPLA
ncbi:non-specific serine/threonine protein kinase [Azotobacter beijerinckii]|uniref:Non-specific serine/threonine protein kinase n=1 Tax=Azotobacter beijerinckii TaxID=170623 RepID=A0A1H6QU38_9GAMM|nr:DEAD/DEAH box helicase [Azotobacter beijerinckii]SEI42765.1 non-specific serine/threonine protein kinase [Azotobacter beijerinckii]